MSPRQPLQERKALPHGEGASVDMDGLSGDVPGARGSEEAGGLKMGLHLDTVRTWRGRFAEQA
ncbi:hypothetical protein ACF9IK_36295 [Kitasatospora hibisci]|uniref:hypothetical protein n=1 Tax=Kitasatospora hibisci TaxID=3369522 RepID=UPI00375428CA